uniref:T-complex 11, testis-specific-like 2 n=1 Tax=Hucho hucho TaxID=62062 RepID=A0A4W5QH66_9TELE
MLCTTPFTEQRKLAVTRIDRGVGGPGAQLSKRTSTLVSSLRNRCLTSPQLFLFLFSFFLCPLFTASPPKTITLDDVMSSARDLSNLTLAHEIIVNRDFHVEQPHLPQNSLEKQVKDIVHKVTPPEYEHAIKLLEEIREILLSVLSPGANWLQIQILEVLDMDLIRQQAYKEAMDIQGLASYIFTIMGKLCAHVRDDEVKNREIFRVLDLMKMDMVNFTIQSLRLDLRRQSVEYERAKFQSIVEKTPSESALLLTFIYEEYFIGNGLAIG